MIHIFYIMLAIFAAIGVCATAFILYDAWCQYKIIKQTKERVVKSREDMEKRRRTLVERRIGSGYITEQEIDQRRELLTNTEK